MADFDTPAKRFSGMGLLAWDPPLLPIVDGVIAQGDWYHLLDLYVGGFPTEPEADSLLPLVFVGS